MTAQVVYAEQGTEEWRKARAGSLGASDVADALAKTSKGYAASRSNVMARLIIERLTGEPVETYQSAAMEWGLATEDEARLAYSWSQDVAVEEVGLIRHPRILGTHASPDGLIASDGLVEIKCPNSATHLKALEGEQPEGKYITQIQWQLAVTGRQWCDLASYDPRMPEPMQLHIQRFERDDARIAELERDVQEFLDELDARIAKLMEMYGDG